jgi:protease IV
MRTLIKTLILLISLASVISAQTYYPSYYEQNRFNMSSPGALKTGLYGYDNPALLSLQQSPDIYFTWSNLNGSFSDFSDWGLFTAVPHFGFSMVNNKVNDGSFIDYKLSTGVGNSTAGIGMGIGWASSETYGINRNTYYSAGLYYRPVPFVSIGLIGNIPTQSYGEGIFDLAIRPLGNEKITLFGDYLIRKEMKDEENKWSAGVIVEAVDGLRISGRYFENEYFKIGVHFSLGGIGITGQTNFPKEGSGDYQVYGIRIGSYDRTVLSQLGSKDDYVKMDMNGALKYQRFRLFDDSKTLLDIIEQIDAAKNDNSVAGIFINISGMNINRQLLWEIREELNDFKSAGKKVVIYFDNAGMNEMHFASVADKIIMDPVGTLQLPGVVWGRQYYKGTLEKLGVGFNELRYFKYKSAAETFANDKMSEADREQLQKLVDDYYELVRKDICEGRNLTTSQFDDFVDNKYFFTPKEAVELGLVDTLARFDEIKNIIKSFEGESKRFVNPGSLTKFKLPEDDYWGKKPQIAIIYALGVCAMDEGIKARSLVNHVRKAVEDDNVKAIILRVDSPGGDGLASDLVAEALKKGKGKKPVIVSQGFVAASGGYWLSMYGDKIVSSPLTITGSIGVIGAFFYNKSLKEGVGVSTDFVKRGKHADLGYGMRFPIFGLTLPDRNFTDEEMTKVESVIKLFYNDFVGRVAEGRNMAVDEIEKIAQGRVWSGSDALNSGLVDELGGLSTAIDLAETEAGLKNKKYEIVQFPSPGWIDLGRFVPGIFGVSDFLIEEDPFITELKFRMKNNGTPMPILPMGDAELLH